MRERVQRPGVGPLLRQVLPHGLFIVFDVEVVFLYPWARLFRRLGMFGFVEMMIFISVLAFGLVYVWRKGALEWD